MFYREITKTFHCESKSTVESVVEELMWREESPTNKEAMWSPGFVRAHSVSYSPAGGLENKELLTEYLGQSCLSIEVVNRISQQIPKLRDHLFLVVECRGEYGSVTKKYSRNTYRSLVRGDFDMSVLDNRIDKGFFYINRVDALKRVHA